MTDDFMAKWDAETLAQANVIYNDPVRFQAARSAIDDLIVERQLQLEGLERAKTQQVSPTLGGSFLMNLIARNP